jgi:hypothetical protein
MTSSAEGVRPLPAQRAFVVQFSTQTNVELGRFAGRVEHVVSGHARRFQTMEDLVEAWCRCSSPWGPYRPRGEKAYTRTPMSRRADMPVTSPAALSSSTGEDQSGG